MNKTINLQGVIMYRNIRLFLFALYVVVVQSVFAQNSGSIQGRVFEMTTRNPLIGANVEVIESSYGAATDMDGYFTISDIPEGIYKLRFSYVGYREFMLTDVRVVRNKETPIGEILLIEAVYETEAVTVSSGAFYEDEERPVSFYSYTNEELTRSPGAGNDLMRSIATMPGVSINTGGEFAAFSVRGGSPQENIIMVDNIPFSKISHLEGGGTEEELGQGGRFSIFSPWLIDNVKFQAGGFPARYGYKNASIVNINIKEGKRRDFDLSAYVDITGGEFLYDGPAYVVENTGILFSAKHRDFNRVLEIIDKKDQGNPRFSDFILKTTTDITPSHKLSLLGVYAPEKFDIELEHIYAGKKLNQTSLVDREEIKSLAALSWRWLIGKKSFLQSSFYHTNSDLKFKHGRVYPDPIDGQIPDINEIPIRENVNNLREIEETFGIRSEYTIKPSAAATVSMGIDMQAVNFDYSFIQNGFDTLYVFDKYDFRPDPNQKYLLTDPAVVNTDYKQQLYNVSGFGQYSHKLLPTLTMTLGGRLDYHEYNEEVYVAPRFSANYSLSSRTSVSFATGTFYQLPKYSFIATNAEAGQLKNEWAWHYILGFGHYFTKDLKFNSEVYYKTFHDLIVKNDRTDISVTNDGRGYAGGIDISLIKRYVSDFYWQISYSFSESRRNNDDGEGWYNSDFHKPHIFNVMAGYELNEEWQLAANWQYASGSPKDDYIIHSDVFNDPTFVRYSKEIVGNNNLRLSPAHTLNFRVDYRKQLGRFAVIAFVDILNLYGNLNVTEERFYETDGTVEEIGFEMLPTFGVKVEM
jgi:outer membrane receptor protein involved in Fe transport